jgi:hypothetical protein
MEGFGQAVGGDGGRRLVAKATIELRGCGGGVVQVPEAGAPRRGLEWRRRRTSRLAAVNRAAS